MVRWHTRVVEGKKRKKTAQGKALWSLEIGLKARMGQKAL